MMKFSATLLRTSCLALAMGVLSATSAPAAEPVVIGIGFPTPLVGPHGAGAKAFKDELERLSPGRFKIQLYPAAALGGEREMVESLQLGNLQMAVTGTAVIGNFVPDLMVLDMPFLFRDYAHARAVLDGPVGQELLGKFKSRGLVGLTFGEIGFRQITTTKRVVNAPDTMKGLKIRTMENPVHLAAFRALGSQPTPMSWAEVVTSLQQGTIDAQENPLSIIVASKLWETQKHLTMSNHAFTAISFTMSPAVFDKLTPAEQDNVRKAAIVGRAANRKYVDEVDKAGLEEVRKHGMQVVTDVDLAAYRKQLEPVYKQYSDRFGPVMTRIAAVK
ncbi:MAG: TRAP transporter substrate-binding protein [Polaromonas sp.]|nr:TRAP transporter substrate-binding protein [Polaromonas sp.]